MQDPQLGLTAKKADRDTSEAGRSLPSLIRDTGAGFLTPSTKGEAHGRITLGEPGAKTPAFGY